MAALWAVLGGLVAVVLGILGVFFWWKNFLIVLMGTVPIILICGGLIALFIGFSEIKDSLKKDDDTSFDDYKMPEETQKSEESPKEEIVEEEKAEDKKDKK